MNQHRHRTRLQGRHTKESDWKLFKSVREAALQRFCERAFGEIEAAQRESGKSAHERYLAIYRLLQERDEELASAFNDFRRSTFVVQLARMDSYGLLTDGELGKFSPEVRGAVESFRENMAALRRRTNEAIG